MSKKEKPTAGDVARITQEVEEAFEALDVPVTKQPSEEEKVIVGFLKKMAEQDNRGTAAPYFYVIRTEVEVQADPDNCDETRYYDHENCVEYDSIEDAELELADDGCDEEEIRLVLDRLEMHGIRKEWSEKGMFLTEEDAEMHLKSNHYHYSQNAHTYVKHAWRAPRLESFFQALFKHFDIKKGNLDL